MVFRMLCLFFCRRYWCNVHHNWLGTCSRAQRFKRIRRPPFGSAGNAYDAISSNVLEGWNRVAEWRIPQGLDPRSRGIGCTQGSSHLSVFDVRAKINSAFKSLLVGKTPTAFDHSGNQTLKALQVISILLKVWTRMNMSGVRLTKDLFIKKRAERAFLRACAQNVDGLNVFSIVKPRSLVESRSCMEAPLSDSVNVRVGAEPIEIWPQLFSFRGMS